MLSLSITTQCIDFRCAGQIWSIDFIGTKKLYNSFRKSILEKFQFIAFLKFQNPLGNVLRRDDPLGGFRGTDRFLGPLSPQAQREIHKKTANRKQRNLFIYCTPYLTVTIIRILVKNVKYKQPDI